VKRLGKIFLLWAIPCWIWSCIAAYVAYVWVFRWYAPEKAYRIAYRITNVWGRAVLAFLFCQYRVTGKEKLGRDRSYVLVSNHVALVDIPLAQVASPVPFSFLAKAETLAYPVVGFLVRSMHLPVDRRSQASRSASFDRMAEHVQRGRSVHIFLEGTRNRTDAPLLPFYDGAFRLALATGAPLAVLAIVGSEKVSPPVGGFAVFPFKRVRCTWTEVIETHGLTEKDLPELKDRVKAALLRELGNRRGI
jgi:1-acyl-sn-glycerol-3-phosphate acyltransferase